MTFDLTNFGLAEMLQCGRGMRSAAAGARTMQGVATAVTGFLREHCVDPATGTRACALVRFYKTHPYASLQSDDRAFALRLLAGAKPTPGLRCLALLATAGDEPAWNDRKRSKGHRAIPLASVQMVESAPMIAALIRQFGLSIDTVISPTQPSEPLAGKSYNVFHVPEARGSSVIPAQEEFVIPYGVRSALGFGGVLRSGDLFAVMMFTKVTVSADTASRFRNLALEVKTLLFNCHADAVFDS